MYRLIVQKGVKDLNTLVVLPFYKIRPLSNVDFIKVEIY